MRVETMEFAISERKYGRSRGPVVMRLFALGGLLILGACSADPQMNMAKSDWIASDAKAQTDPRKLEIDRRVCQLTAKSSQGTQADSFSDPRYGAVNAMADALGRDSINETSVKLRQSARFELCMRSLGWRH